MKIIIILLSLFVVSCSSTGEKLNSYDREEINKPYTVPAGIKTWETTVSSVFPITSDESNFWWFNPLQWKTPLTDNFTIVWGPLPLGMDVTLYNKEKSTVGLSASYYFIYFYSELSYRYKISDWFAIKPRIYYSNFNFIFEERKRVAEINFLFQMNEKWSLGANVGKGNLRMDNDFYGRLFSALSGTTVSFKENYNITTYGLTSNIQLGKQWDVNTSLSQIYVNDLNKSTALFFDASFIHYWD
jgi:hypothetical protein